MSDIRIGIGYDSHRLVGGRQLILGGIRIPFAKGLLGHSDADVLCHAMIDAILGALGLGDIGKHFPDTDSKWKDVSSIEMLGLVIELMSQKGLALQWLDSTIIAEEPKISSYIELLKEAISRSGIPSELINIKAKTNEGMGFIGRGEGIAAFAVCVLRQCGGRTERGHGHPPHPRHLGATDGQIHKRIRQQRGGRTR